MRKILYLTIALLCTVAQGAWATDVATAQQLRDAISDGANITLTADINISSAITIGDDANFKPTVTINLGGHTLNRGCTSRGSQVIGVFTGSTLYLSNGTVTGGWGGNGGGLLNKEGTVHLTNVIIDGNTADDRGVSDNKRETINNNRCYDLQGRKLNSQFSPLTSHPTPLKKGVYIYNGIKRVIK